jgi:hypothetical protein
MIDPYAIARVRDNAPEIYTVTILESRETPYLPGNEVVPPGTKLETRLRGLSYAAVAVKARIVEVLRSARNASLEEEITILYKRHIQVLEVRMDGSLVYEQALVIGGGPSFLLKPGGETVAVYLEPDGNGCFRAVMDGHGIASNHDLWKRHLEDRTVTQLEDPTLRNDEIPESLRRAAEFCRKAQPQCRVVFIPEADQNYLLEVSIPDPQHLLTMRSDGRDRLASCSDDELWNFLKVFSHGKIKRPD